MSSPEHIFRPREVYASIDKMGGLSTGQTEPTIPYQHPLSGVSQSDPTFSASSEHPIHDDKKARRKQWEKTGYVPPIVGGTSNKIPRPLPQDDPFHPDYPASPYHGDPLDPTTITEPNEQVAYIAHLKYSHAYNKLRQEGRTPQSEAENEALWQQIWIETVQELGYPVDKAPDQSGPNA